MNFDPLLLSCICFYAGFICAFHASAMAEKLHHSVGVDWAFPYFCFFAVRKSFFLAQLVVFANLFHSGRKGTPLLESLLIRHLGYNFLLTKHYFEIPPPVAWSRNCLAGAVLSGGNPLLLWGLHLCYVHIPVPELTLFISVFRGTGPHSSIHHTSLCWP